MIAAARAHAGTSSKAPPTGLPERYVRIPQRLLTSAVYRPLQIGIYSLTARLFLVSKAPVPLSATDIIRYDPSLSRGATQRALTSLVDKGWLIATERVGQKTTYIPSWGRVNGSPLPWRIGALCLDRPRHVRAVCLDLRLLDLFLGKLTPHPQRAAVITRYVTAPLLALADVGSYALLLGGLPGATPSLIMWELTRDEQPLPLPEDMVILARASQRRLFDENDTMLTARGLQKAGLIAHTTAADSTQPLFFVPPDVIADWPIQIPTNLIDYDLGTEERFTALQSQNIPEATTSPGITWESLGVQETQRESTPNPHTRNTGGGVAVNGKSVTRARSALQPPEVVELKAPRPAPVLPNTEAARALSAINVLPDQIVELADIPMTVVIAAIRDGQARPAVRDLAGWVVTLLRAQRDQGWKIAPPRHDSPEALRESFAHYAAAQAAEHTEGMDDEHPASAPLAPALCNLSGTQIQMWNDVLSTLKLQLTRQEFNTWIRPATLLSVARSIATIAVPNVRVKEAVENRYRALLRDLLTDIHGEQIIVQVILNGAQDNRPAAPPRCNQGDTSICAEQMLPTPNPEPNCRPDWICAERWETLPVMLRAMLIGSTLEDGQIHAASPYFDQLLQVRYMEAVTTLIRNM